MGKIEWMKLQILKHGPTSRIRLRALAATQLAEVGDDCYIGSGTTITPLGGNSHGKVLLKIGDRVAIGPNTTFACSGHPEQSILSSQYGGMEEIVVRDDVWIGCDVTIVGGVELGAASIVAAGSVVTEDVPSRTVVGGVPAEKIKDVPESVWE